jgi:alanyl-tRNA synthetase
MDYNQELTIEQLRQVEWEANRAVAQNLPVLVSYPSDEELQTLSYRSKKEILEQIRIVSIPGYDVCACCAPHVTHTGQVGMIKLTQMQRYKGGVRVHMLCGFRALHAYTKQQEQVAEVMQALSVPETGVAQGVLRMKEELTQWKYRHAQLQKAYLQGYAKELAQQTSAYVVQMETQLDAEGARVLMNELLEYGKELCAIFCETNENEFRYVIGSKSIDVRPLASWMKEELSGRGGEKPQMIQGSVFGESEAIKAWMMNAINKLKEPHQKEVHKEEQHA